MLRPKRTDKKKPPSSHKPVSGIFVRSVRRMVFFTAPFLLALLLAYLAYQDYTVREQFEGKRWALPARVYASPAEVFAGSYFEADTFERLLKELKFRSDAALSSHGAYVHSS